MIKTKLTAFLAHLGISLMIFLIVLYFIVFHWYPVPFFSSDGGWYGIRIIAGVDLVLGPVLTFVIFKPKKPGLKFDLTVIGIIQASALAWGCWFVHLERPIATVFAQGYFLTMKADEFERRGVSNEKLKTFGEQTPVWIYSRLPKDPDELHALRITAMNSVRAVHSFPEYYVPIGKNEITAITSSSIAMDRFLRDKPEGRKKYLAFMQKHQEIKDRLVFIRWRARFKYKIVALLSDNLEYIGTLDIIPPDPVDIQGTAARNRNKSGK